MRERERERERERDFTSLRGDSMPFFMEAAMVLVKF
jgi:hypothetical protein